MAKLNDVRIDPNLEVEGVWIHWAAGIEFKLARIGNPKFKDAMRRRGAPYKRRINNDAELQERIMRECIPGTIILDWRNIEDDNGSPLPYSDEACLKMMKDPTLEQLFQWVVLTANTHTLFSQAARDEYDADTENDETEDGSGNV